MRSGHAGIAWPLGVIAMLGLIGTAGAWAASASADAPRSRAGGGRVVEPWIRATLTEIRRTRTNPPRAARALALVSVATLDAVRATPAGSPTGATVAATVAPVLTHVFPAGRPRFESLERRALRARAGAGGTRVATAVRRGRSVARRTIRRAARDGSARTETIVRPVGPEFWEPAPGGPTQPLEPLAGTWRPWNLRSGSEFRPPAPPGIDSPTFDAQARYVHEISRPLAPEHAAIATRWADGPGTVTPPGHWNLVALDLVRAGRVGIRRAARLFAALNTAQADAFIACWDAKFTYWSVRPVTVIRRTIDPSWSPYIPTPQFPSYPSGHATTSSAAATVLGAFFRRESAALRAQAREAADSRFYGGIHYPFDNDAGLELGRRVAAAALR